MLKDKLELIRITQNAKSSQLEWETNPVIS